MTRATRRTIPAPAHRLPIGNRGTRSRPQAVHRAKPTQLPSRAWPEFSGLNTVAKNGLANLGKQAMSTHPLAQPGQARIVGRASQYVVAACSGIFTLMSIFVGVKVSAATAWSGAAPAAAAALEIVDRTGKGDRLPLAPALDRDLVVGAISVLRRAKLNPEKYPWLTQLLARRPFKVVAIALANKMARIAWALLANGSHYRPRLATT